VKLAATLPKLTPVAPVKALPLMVTLTPPPDPPVFGLTPVTDGTELAANVKRSAETPGDVPLGVIATMSTVPAGSGGDTAVMLVEELTVKEAAGVPPK
jgi:hypothetical protein